MSTAIIHLGTHKAASTSIQLFLAHNRERLAEGGVCYPLAPPPTSFAHHGLAWSIIRKYTSLERRPANFSLSNALDQFRESEADTLVLSSEDFLTTSSYDGFLQSFFSELRETFERVMVCAFVRSRLDFFNSSYNQWVKSLSYSKHFSQYIDQVLTGGQAQMHYTRSLALWGQHADKCVYLPFHVGQFDAAPERVLLQNLGLERDLVESLEAFSTAALNASIGPLAIIAFRRLAHVLHQSDWYEHYDLEKREQLLHGLEARAAGAGWNAEKFRAATRTHAERIQRAFSAEDDLFAETFLGASWQEIFPQDYRINDSTELRYADLDDAIKAEIDEFVGEGLCTARAIYMPDENTSATDQAPESSTQEENFHGA